MSVQIGLHDPQDPRNIGGVLRAAFIYGADAVWVHTHDARRFRKGVRNGTNTCKAQRHINVIQMTSPLDKGLRPGLESVAVECVDWATPLPEFIHPEQAIYLFGPENGSLPKGLQAAADHNVVIPTRYCMNLAATVNVVLYDRLAKTQERTDHG